MPPVPFQQSVQERPLFKRVEEILRWLNPQLEGTMRLIQAKARCVEGVRDTGWFVPGRETTVIYDRDGKSVSFLFKALEAVNPLFSVTCQQPFLNHPKIWQQGTHGRKVIPEKKTAVMMVFSAVPELVRELSGVDELLFETDRIEVGRRLDYSRWLTFVEIPASGRWSEVKDDFHLLRTLVRSPEYQARCSFIDDLLETDRLKGELAATCRNWLSWLLENVPEFQAEQRGIHRRCMKVVDRELRFAQARRQAAKWLPATLAVRMHCFSEGVHSRNNGGVMELVDNLLKKLNQLRGEGELTGNWRKSLAVYREALESEPAFKSLAVRPELLLETDRARIAGFEAAALLPLLQSQLYLICLITVLVSGQRPLLLLDLTDCPVDERERTPLVEWLQLLGESCQLIVGTESESFVREGGWQSVLRPAGRTLEESGLIVDQP